MINAYRFDSRSLSLVFRVSSCVDDNAKILMLFRDGSRATAFADSKFDCDGRAAIHFGDVFGHEDLLRMLKTKPLETIRIYGYKSVVINEDFTEAQSALLMAELNCLDD